MTNQLKTHLLLLGAAKCGTTFLSGLLNQHPRLCMSDPKEPFFFEAQYEKGVQFYLEHYFSNAQPNQYTGDARHRNLLLPYVPRRIAKVVDNPKFVVVLRNPLERTFSHWWHWKTRGVETRSFQEVVHMGLQGNEFYGLSTDELEQSYPDALQMNGYSQGYSRFEAYVASSRYANQLERYLALFGKERILIVFHEDLIQDPASEVHRIWDFLGLDTYEKVNLKPTSKNPASNLRANRWVNYLKNIPGSSLVPRGARSKFVSVINTVIGSQDYKIERKKNLQEFGLDLSGFFMNDVEWLEQQTGKDLSAWEKWK